MIIQVDSLSHLLDKESVLATVNKSKWSQPLRRPKEIIIIWFNLDLRNNNYNNID